MNRGADVVKEQNIMQVHTFIAESAADAVAQIRETLGAEAVVLNVRRAASAGFSRLWQKPRIEVLAHVPEKSGALPSGGVVDTAAVAELREELREIREKLQPPQCGSGGGGAAAEFGPDADFYGKCMGDEGARGVAQATADGGWRVGGLLENSGMLPLYAQRVVEELRRVHGEIAPEHLRQEIRMAFEVLRGYWRRSSPAESGVHVFVGAPGAGKTTALCKWLAQSTLVEGRSAAVWRLDGHVANTAESLSIFCEILDVPVERFVARGGRKPERDLLFVDLPGVNPADATAMNELGKQLSLLPQAQLHLVLNGAYEPALMLAQVRAYAALGANDVIVTHLDEETRRGKLWNLVLGTNCSLRHLAAGQNIPGDFVVATPERIFMEQFPGKRPILPPEKRVADALLNRG